MVRDCEEVDLLSGSDVIDGAVLLAPPLQNLFAVVPPRPGAELYHCSERENNICGKYCRSDYDSDMHIGTYILHITVPHT